MKKNKESKPIVIIDDYQEYGVLEELHPWFREMYSDILYEHKKNKTTDIFQFHRD